MRFLTVLLCWTALVHPSLRGAEPVKVAIEMRGGRVMVPAVVNGSASRSFMMDSGFQMSFLSAEHAEELGIERTGHVTILGIAGDEEADVFEGVKFLFGGSQWAPRRVAAFPAPARGRSRARPGVLGSGFFRRYVVDVNPESKVMRLHEPGSFQYDGEAEVLELEFRRTTPSIRAQLSFPGHDPVEGRFDIDTGCDGGLCVGEDFVKNHNLVSLAGETRAGGRVGVGGDVDTLMTKIPEFRMGRIAVKDAEANFFLDGSPVTRGYAGHIGSGILSQFRVIYDYSRNRMLLISPPPPD